MARVMILTIGEGPLLRPVAAAVAKGASTHGNTVIKHEPGTAPKKLSRGLVQDLRGSVGVAIGSSLSPQPTEECLEALHRLTLATVTLEQLGVRVATSFTTLPQAEPSAAEAVDRMNRLLYRWGAVIVAPGYADAPEVTWMDNRPGIAAHPDHPAALRELSLDAAERQGRRLGTIVAVVGAAMDRPGGLQL
jgi:hypothetical protein